MHSILRLSVLLNLAPDPARWSAEEKEALQGIIVAKCRETEQRYQRLLNTHARLRKAILKLGAAPQ